MTAPTSSEARGYFALLTSPAKEKHLYALFGSATYLTIETPEQGIYTIETMTIGKNNILDPDKVRKNVVTWSNWSTEDIIQQTLKKFEKTQNTTLKTLLNL
jgi:hypothetical protein